MKLYPASVRLRLTLWHFFVLATVILVFCGGVYFFLRHSLRSQLDEQLSNDAAVLKSMVSSGEVEDPEELQEAEQEQLVEYFLLRRTGRPTFRSRAWQRAGLDDIFQTTGSSALRSGVAADGRPFRFISASSVGRADTVTIGVARPESLILDSLHRLRLILALAVPVALLLAVVGGFLLAGRALSPIQTMAEKARLITADNLADRLPIENPNDELGQLADVFNDMLSRLQDAFERLRRFTADASHELRTPLTVIRSVGEVGLRTDQHEASYRETIGSMLEETDSLARLTDDLLALTRLDAGPSSRARQSMEISGLVAEVADCLRVLAEEKGQEMRLDLEWGITVTIDRVMIRQALINILDNAVKYSPPGGTISVSVGKTETGKACIAIEDEGPGIPPAERRRIFERFYRMPQSPEARRSGAGLGLSIALRAVEREGGRIEVSEGANGGSVFNVIL